MRAFKRIARAILGKSGQRRPPLSTSAPSYRNDVAFHEGYARAKEKTGPVVLDIESRRLRFYTLVQLVRNAPLRDGEACELGCWYGLSTYQIAAQIKASGLQTRFHVFDSFAGVSPADANDNPRRPDIRRPPGEHVAPPSLETVKRSLSEFSFIDYHPGWIPERFPDVAERRFSFVHVDVARYQPTRDAFEFFYPRLVPGGIMVFDDYGFTQVPGARRAVDECLAPLDSPFFVVLPSGQAFLIKPAR